MTNTPAGWDGLLESGETILWQGRPRGGVIWADILSAESLFGIPFTAFALFWTAMASSMSGGDTGPGGPIALLFPLFGLPFIVVGVYMLVGRLFWDAYVRRNTWYTLTSAGAFVATQTLGRRSLKRYPYDAMVEPELEDNTPGTVWFGEEIRLVRSGGRNGPTRTREQRIRKGFRQIDEARSVYRMILEHRRAAKD